jgi:hypothetical protein
VNCKRRIDGFWSDSFKSATAAIGELPRGPRAEEEKCYQMPWLAHPCKAANPLLLVTRMDLEEDGQQGSRRGRRRKTSLKMILNLMMMIDDNDEEEEGRKRMNEENR